MKGIFRRIIVVYVITWLTSGFVVAQFTLQDFNLEVNIKSVRIKGNKALAGSNTLLEFATNGLLERETHYVASNKIDLIIQYTYALTEAGRIKRILAYKIHPDSALINTVNFSYDKTNRLTKKTEKAENYQLSITYFYESNEVNMLTKTVAVYYNMITADSTIRESYYEFGRKVRTVVYKQGQISAEYTCQYNTRGDVVVRSEFVYINKEKVRQNTNVGGVPCDNCLYKYDKHNNWKKRYLKTNNGKIWYEKRNIIYY